MSLRTPPPRFARAALCAAVLLVASACQTPWSAAVLLREPVPQHEVAPSTELALYAPELDAPRFEPPRDPTLEERIAALLVKRAPKMLPVDRARVAGAIHEANRTHGVDPLLVLAVIEQESTFKVDALGPRGSMGLMQVRPFVAADIAKRHGIPWSGAKTLLDPAANVQIGAMYLGEMLEMYPDPALAIAAYNMGPYRVQRLIARGHVPRPAYLISVLKRLQSIASEFGPLPDDPIQEASAE